MWLIPDIEIYCTESYRETKDYGSWHDSFSYTIGTDIKISHSDKYGAIPVNFPVEESDIVYVVHIIWSTGDSFGNSDCGSNDTLLYKNREDAERAVHNFQNAKEYHAVIPMPDGSSDFRYYIAWNGYFESLESITIHEMIVCK